MPVNSTVYLPKFTGINEKNKPITDSVLADSVIAEYNLIDVSLAQ